MKANVRRGSWMQAGKAHPQSIRKEIKGCLEKEISKLRLEIYGLAKATKERKAREAGKPVARQRKLDKHGRTKGEARAHTAGLRAKEAADQARFPTSWAR